MKKVTAIVCYEGTTIKAITVVNADSLFVQFGSAYYDINKVFDTLNDAYAFVIKLLKMNNYELDHYRAFGREWYDIIWYSTYNPTYQQKFGYFPAKTTE